MDVANSTNLFYEKNIDFNDRDFLALMVVSLIGAGIFMANVFTNSEIVTFEQQFSNGLSSWGFFIVVVILALLTDYMVYKPYKKDRANNGTIVIWALIYYIIAQILWSTGLFHSRTNRGAATIALILLLCATIWLGWVCYHFNPESILITILLLIWWFYLVIYTYNVGKHPWSNM